MIIDPKSRLTGQDLKENNHEPALLAYDKLSPGLQMLSPQTILHFAIDLYNCAVDIFQNDDAKMSIKWASSTLDCIGSKNFEDELGKKRDSIVLNASRLLG